MRPGLRPGPGRIALFGRDRNELLLQGTPAPDIFEAQKNQRREAGYDQAELQHLVVDCRAQSAEEDIDEHNPSRYRNAGAVVPAQEEL